MNELGPEARALIERGRRLDGPPAGAKARIHDALRARIEAGPGSSGPSGSAGPWVGGVAALGVAAATVMLWPTSTSEPERALAEPQRGGPGAFEHVRLQPPSEDEVEASAAPTGAQEHASSQKTANRSPRDDGPGATVQEDGAAEPEQGDLLAEARLMADAQRRLRDADWAGAVELAEAHRERFPDGMLIEERWGVMALAKCALGEVSEGLALRRRIEARNASSALLPRIDDRCR